MNNAAKEAHILRHAGEVSWWQGGGKRNRMNVHSTRMRWSKITRRLDFCRIGY